MAYGGDEGRLIAAGALKGILITLTLGDIAAKAHRNIFNDIIDMDKMERRKVQLDNQPVDFTSFLADLENLSGLQAQQKGLSMKVVLSRLARSRAS